jgi:aspartyl-tRNA(Asn)/glutamyl-tRNA(Gln) amidotransferase subunit A
MDTIFFYRNPETATPGDGHLQGLKIAIQPNISLAGWPADAGSNALANFTALEDATIVRRLREAGAYVYGSTRMSEFGFGLLNSKAGDALKQQAADAELVIDLMGESRMAASRAAVCGFKPSYGLVSRFGLIGLIPSMECCGVLSGNLKNIRDILKAIAGQDELDFSLPDEKTPDFSPQKISPKKTTIGVITEAQSSLSAGQEKMFRASVDELKEAGFCLLEMSLPDFSLFSLVHRIVGSVEASSSAGRYDSVRYGQRAAGAKNWNDMYLLSRGAAFGPLLKGYLFQGSFFQFERYKAYEDTCRIRARLLADMQQLTSQVDFLVLPAVNYTPSGAPASLADTYAQFASTAFANVTGQPALYLPPAPGAAQSGFQIAGQRLSDARLLALGEHLLNMRRGGK